jgi:hypothetical protein
LQIMEKADVLEYYDQAVKSTDQDYFIPAVLRLHICSKTEEGPAKP